MDIWKVIDTYFKSNQYYFTRHHIDSYNDFVINKIPYIIETLNPFIIVKEDSAYRVEVTVDPNIKIINPVYDTDKMMYPNVARLQNKNYFCDIVTNVTIRYFQKDEKVQEDVFDDKKIGSLPILLHSKLCYLNGLDIKTLRDLGECQYDQGGYFIVDGKEKVIISQERIATNQLFLSDPKDPEVYKLEGMIRSTALTNSLFPKTLYFWVEKDRYMDSNNKYVYMDNSFFVNVKIMNIKLEHIPLFVIFRALGIESDKDIIEYITMGNKDLMKHLRSSVVNASNVTVNDKIIFTQKQALQYLSNFVKYDDVEYVKYLFMNDLFPNVGNDFRQKAMYLGYLVNRLVRTAIGELKQNKRDNYMFKRVDTTGILLGNIFRDFYNKLRNNVRMTIDREYTMGGTNNKYKLVSQSNFHRVFPHSIIGEGLYKSMKGNWGLTGDPSEQGIVQDVSRLSYTGYVSHLRRVNTPIDRSIKLVEPHRLDTPQWGMMCPIESPDGANIGLLKHMAATCEITLESNREAIMECLTDLDMIPLENINPRMLNKTVCKLNLNNNWVGIHREPRELLETLREYRRTGVLNAFISISWDVIENEIHIFSDSGRCCRPVIIADKLDKLDYNLKFWKDYVSGYSYKYTYDKSKKSNIQSNIEYIDCFETNSLLIAMIKDDIGERTTHLEIHPCLCMSMYTNTIPFANHNQAPRNVFSGQQGKQALGIYATNFNHRIDTASYVLHYPQRSLLSTKLANYTFKNKMPNGENLIVAIATYTGYNQEDSIILNKSSIERGMFNVSYFKSIVDAEDENINNNIKVVYDNPVKLKREGKDINYKLANWDIIDQDGIPIENNYISENDCYLGKINIEAVEKETTDETVFNNQNVSYVYKDKSLVADKTLSGTIDKVLKYENNQGVNQVKIRLRKFRIPELGDKMASSHGQKGVCGMILPQEDMPYNKNGLVPDIIVNPHAFPSRMTIAHLIESVLAKLCCLEGQYIDGTPFEDHNIPEYYNLLKKYGYHQYGDEILYNGFTGDQIETQIFFGPTYYYRLKHMVKDKINYRSSGPVEMMTKQPTQGRSNGGGLRIGEMETNAILGHGITSFINETMTTRSDKYHTYIDSETGEDIIYNEKEGYYNSLNAKKIEIPYCAKLMKQEVESLGVNMKFITKKYDI